jgi:ribosomal protein S18 acetylase RimI-like enzyme
MVYENKSGSLSSLGRPRRRPSVVIKPLRDLNERILKRMIVGYTTSEVYLVQKEESESNVKFELSLRPLEHVKIKRYHDLDTESVREYLAMAEQGHSFGAYASATLIGIALTDVRLWNSTLWVQEFHIAPKYQGRGIGRQLMDAVALEASRCGLRAIVCETQVSNVPAIRFYRAVGFFMDGLDLSYYSNDDRELGEVAVFMKRRIPT